MQLLYLVLHGYHDLYLNCLVGWCIDKGDCKCSMPECYGPNKRSCADRMCSDLFEFISNERNCRSGPKYKTVTMALHFFGSLLGLGNFYSGRHHIGLMQLLHGISTLYHWMIKPHKRNEGRKVLLTITAFAWWLIELIVVHYEHKVDGNGCPLYA